jgi:hypothetical protein
MDGFSNERSYRLLVYSSSSCQPNELISIIQAFSIYRIFVQRLTIPKFNR